ncbi:uncharacterized protein B0H18DRAFT_1027497 [Fomitopsis serialis]|uniref:uncharacterized protein n=1 Tax=Fomitopsis serialis TaxID=139415 RepID=UPI002008B9A2|nr:uncharacterized protein B0H18DRAFT_1027497 [Neoantrodia serialis]KAH9919533.1 hypothetical protein B0H18DRAFT_1027497 [Neoantrodia serialis]
MPRGGGEPRPLPPTPKPKPRPLPPTPKPKPRPLPKPPTSRRSLSDSELEERDLDEESLLQRAFDDEGAFWVRSDPGRPRPPPPPPPPPHPRPRPPRPVGPRPMPRGVEGLSDSELEERDFDEEAFWTRDVMPRGGGEPRPLPPTPKPKPRPLPPTPKPKPKPRPLPKPPTSRRSLSEVEELLAREFEEELFARAMEIDELD